MVWALDIDGFFTAMQANLTGTNGYSMELRHHGAQVRAYSAGDAVDGPAESSAGTVVSTVPWSTAVGMQIGSCSKLITAIALTKLLADQGISAAAPILPYLPRYWNPGPNVGELTFANLMAQTSGLTQPNTNLANQTYTAARNSIEQGVADATTIGPAGDLNQKQWDYLNVTFDLCRILMATVSGAVDVGFVYRAAPPGGSGPGTILVPPGHQPLTPVEADDAVWDAATLNFYLSYVQENVLGPPGVTASMERPDVCAVAYTAPPVTTPGWNSGNMTEYAGPTGWHTSVDGMLTLMGAFRRAGTIMSAQAAQAMLDARYGIDWGDNLIPQTCPAGPLYPKNGSDGDGFGRLEQTSVVFLPLDMEFAVWVNSPTTDSLLLMTCSAFVDNVVDQPVLAGP